MATQSRVLSCFWALCWRLLCVEGLILTLRNKLIPVDGSGRILITDIGYNSRNALNCSSLDVDALEGIWYLHPTAKTNLFNFAINYSHRGWYENKDYHAVSLWRDSGTIAEEGVFTCNIVGDRNTPVSVGIYYSIQSVSATIDVVSQRKGTFRVQCTSRGGRALRMNVTGPGDFTSNLDNIQAVGTAQRLGNDSFYGTTDVISRQNDMDSYWCTASNGLSFAPRNNTRLRVAPAPIITSLQQLSPTVVRVKWSKPSGGASVTGYVVHYFDGTTNRSKNVIASTTSSNITNLTKGPTYTISVEATSKHLSGESANMSITLNPAPSGVTVNHVLSTSVNISWQAVEGANSYHVTLTQTMGSTQQGLCSDSHTISHDTSNLSIVVGQTDDDMLRAYATYAATVVAVSDLWGRSGGSTPMIFTTRQKGAAVAPSDVRAVVESSTVIIVKWNGLVPCMKVNGIIVKYRVQYTAESSGVIQSTDHSAEWDVTGAQVSLTGLTPFTNYSIQVAAVNEQDDVGLYSYSVVELTEEDTPGSVIITLFPSYFKITITWNPPERPNGIIIAYEVSYRPTDSSAPHTRSNTTGLETNFSTQSNLELESYYVLTVRAYTQVGPGNPTSVMVSTLSTLSAVQGVAVVSLNNTAAIISWNALIVSGVSIDYYIVVYSRNGKSRDGEKRAMFDLFTTSGVITDLHAGDVYRFQVYATLTADGRLLEGERSTPVNFTIPMDNADNQIGALAAGATGGVLAVGVIISIFIILCIILKKRCVSNQKTSHRHLLETLSLPLSPITSSPSNNVTASEEKNTDMKNSILEPLIAMFPEEKQVLEGEEVMFSVNVTGISQPKITWYHNGEEVVEDYSKELAPDGSLIIPSAELKHNGVYQMVATNATGIVDKRVILRVQQEGQQSDHVAKKQSFLSPIPVETFGDYVYQCHANDNEDFKKQFTEIDKDIGYPKTIGLSPNFKKFNRFTNITVYDDNRIVLRPIEGRSDCQRGFINACYVDGYKFASEFIATQGPLPETTIDFWHLVWQEKPNTIVMVTNLVEAGRTKCHQYWPDTGTKSFGPFQVTITDQQILADYTIRGLLVQMTGSSETTLKMTQFHFTAWPDHGVPDYATPLLAFHKKLKTQHRPSKGPMLIHCSAGVGRTGTLITIDRILNQLQKERVVDIAGTILHLRSQRMKMVQTVEQYIFIHDAILEAVTCGDTQISAGDLHKSIQKLSHRDPKTNLTGFESQFKVLEKVSPNPRETLRLKALQNPAKNRTNDFLPGDSWRVLLFGDTQNYIHAVAVNGYKQRRAFIIAQSPMQSTARDFLKMVHDRSCGVVVMLCDLIEAGQEACFQYWPNTGAVKMGEYTVQLLGEEKKEGYILRTINIQYKKSKKVHQVVQLHITNWASDGHCSNLKTITDVIAEMNVVQRRTRNHPIVIHCSDTVSRSGMFCAIATTIERCKVEGVVDVFQVVKALRAQKPGAVRAVAQFCTVFQAVLVYLDSFDTYDNFNDQ